MTLEVGFTTQRSFTAIVLRIACVMLACLPVSAQIVNGDFEGGDLTGWNTAGTSVVEVLQASNFSPNIPLPEGTFYCLLSTGPDNQGGAGADIDGNGINEYDIARLNQTFSTPIDNDVITFRWGMLSREADQPAQFDDIFRVSIDGTPVLFGSANKPGGISPYPDSPAYDGLDYTVSSTGPTDGSWFFDTANDGFSGFATFSIMIPTAGVHTIEFLVADQGDGLYDSGLLIDEVFLNSSQDIFQMTSTSGSQVEAKGGGLVWTAAESRSTAISDDGLTLAFLSNGDFGTGNPNLQLQVFALKNGTYERLTSMTDGSASRPSLSADGRYVAYSATDDPNPLGSPNNNDLNQEIFIRDRALASLVQVTNTAVVGCANVNPSIGGAAGDRVAFQTNCTDLPGVSGGTTVVAWNGATFQSLAVASGCTSRNPEMSVDGRYVAFISDCNHTGGNGDGNLEVFLWDLQTPAVSQITTSAAGEANDSVDLSADAAELVFVSNADYDAAIDNSDQNFEVFVWNGVTTTQITDTSFFDLHLVARITDSGRFLAWERLNIFTTLFTLSAYDRLDNSEDTLVAGQVNLPGLGVDFITNPTQPEAVVAFQSADELVPPNNADTNMEIFTTRLVVPLGPQTFCSAPNLGIAIPDKGDANPNVGITHTITVPDIGTITDVNVSLMINHTFVADVQVWLNHTVGFDARLIKGPRVGPTECPGDNIDVTLDDEGAGGDVDSQCNAVPPAIFSPPSFTPDQALVLFDGLPSAGAWTISIIDTGNNNQVGTLEQWCVTITAN